MAAGATATLVFFSPLTTRALGFWAKPVVTGERLTRQGPLTWTFGRGRFVCPGEPLGFETLSVAIHPLSFPYPLSISVVPNTAWEREALGHLMSTVALPSSIGIRELTLTSGGNPMTFWVDGFTLMARGAVVVSNIHPAHPFEGSAGGAILSNITVRTGRRNLILQVPAATGDLRGGRWSLRLPRVVAGWMGGSFHGAGLAASGPVTGVGPVEAAGGIPIDSFILERLDVALTPDPGAAGGSGPLPVPPMNVGVFRLASFGFQWGGPGGQSILSVPAGTLAATRISLSEKGFQAEGMDATAVLAGGPQVGFTWHQDADRGDLSLSLGPFPFSNLEPLAQTLAGWQSVKGRLLKLAAQGSLTAPSLTGRGVCHWQGLGLVDGNGEPMTVFRPNNLPGQGAQPLVIFAPNGDGTVGPLRALELLGPELLQAMRKF